jgi:hypothetical protein
MKTMLQYTIIQLLCYKNSRKALGSTKISGMILKTAAGSNEETQDVETDKACKVTVALSIMCKASIQECLNAQKTAFIHRIHLRFSGLYAFLLKT